MMTIDMDYRLKQIVASGEYRCANYGEQVDYDVLVLLNRIEELERELEEKKGIVERLQQDLHKPMVTGAI